MNFGVLGAVADPGFPVAADIAGVVEQRHNLANLSQLRAQLLGPDVVALVAVHQPRHRQADVKYMLDIVVTGVTGEKAGQLSAIKGQKIAVDTLDQGKIRTRVTAPENSQHFRTDRLGVGHIHETADVHLQLTAGLRHIRYPCRCSQYTPYLSSPETARPGARFRSLC